MGMPSCSCMPPDKDGGKWIRECDYHMEIRLERDIFKCLCTKAGLLSSQKERNDAIALIDNMIGNGGNETDVDCFAGYIDYVYTLDRALSSREVRYMFGVMGRVNTEKILEIAKLNDVHRLNHPAADKFCIQFANAILDEERTELKKLYSHAGLLKVQESHNRYVDLVNELIEAAAPFLSPDIVDETCCTIQLMNRLELAINNLRLK